MYPMVLLAANSFGLWMDPYKLLVYCSIALGVMYIWYVLTVIQQIKTHLGIRALHLSPKSD